MKSKKIVAIIIAFIMIFSYISPVIAVSKTSFTVKRSAERDGYQYWINGKRVNKFTVSGYGAAYCLKADANFNEKSYSYNRSYNMKTEVKAIKGVDWKSSELTHTKKEVGIKRTYEKTDSGAYAYTRPKLTVNESGTGVTYCNYNAVLWLLDNMYIPVSSSTKNKEFKKQLYEEVFATAIEKHNFKVSSVKLTDEDIQVVQQWAIWYFTNSEESKYHVTTLPTVKVKNSSGGTLHTINSLGETGRNQKYMNALYVYLIENAMRNAKDYGYGDTRSITTNYVTKGYLCSIAGSYGTQQPILKAIREIPSNNKYTLVIRKFDKKTGELIDSNMKVSIKNPDGTTSKGVTVKGTKEIRYDITDITENDHITITETSAPSGYEVMDEGIKLNIKKKIINGEYSVYKATAAGTSGFDLDNVKIHVIAGNELSSEYTRSNAVYVDIYDEAIDGGFNFNIQKVDADTKETINSTAKFVLVEKPDNVKGKTEAKTKNGIANFGHQTITSSEKAGTYKYYITEDQAPAGYIGLDKLTMIELSVDVELNSDKTGYQVVGSSVVLVDLNKKVIDNNPDNLQVEITENKNVVLTVENEKISGKYQMDLVKVDADTGLELDDAIFDVSCTHYDAQGSEVSTDSLGSPITRIEQDITSVGKDVYTITEVKEPAGYVKLENPVTITVNKVLFGDKYMVMGVTPDEEDKDKVVIERTSDDGYGITVKIKNTKLEGKYQLQIQKQDENGNNIDGASFMVYYPNGNTESFTYNDKVSNPNPLVEQQIYAEGTDEWIITEIGPPEGYVRLEKKIYVRVTKIMDEENNKWDISDIEIKDEDGNDVDYVSCERDDGNNIFTITIKNTKVEGEYNICYIKQDSSTGERISTSDTILNITRNDEEPVSVTLKAGMQIEGPYKIESNGQIDTYIIEEVEGPEGYTRLKEPIEFKVHSYELSGKYVPSWVESESEYVEMDVDYSTGIVYISINNDKITSAYQLDLLKIDAETKEQLDGAEFAIKYPGETEYEELIFEDGDFLTGPIEMTNTETDVIYIKETKAPQGYVKLIDELKVEVTKELDGEKYVVKDIKVTNADGSETETKIETNLKNESTIEIKIPNKLEEGLYNLEIIKYDEEGTVLQGAVFTVTMPDGTLKEFTTNSEGIANLGNIEITSEGTVEFIIKETKAPEGYLGLSDEFKTKVTTVKTSDGYAVENVELEKNGQNVEYIKKSSQIQISVTNKKLTDYDLSLRKFITSVNENMPEISREPVVDTSKLVEGSSTTATYTHTKDPLLVANSDIVVYTLRMYNEGITDTYAAEVKDDIPQGLEFIPDNEINTKYGWKMYDETGTETTDVTEAKTIKTDYLSKEQSEARGEDNLLKAFEYKEGAELDYRDVQVAFKVVSEYDLPDKIIINTAEITKETDENGEQVIDRDSTPDNDKEDEDDIDKEYLRLKYFDLSLLKWVSSAMVTENGKTTETLTGHTGLEDPEPVVKVDLNRKKLDEVTVKFAYTIKVTNEGELEGYAKEISDYIPEGLKFVAEDNPEWTEKDGKIVTRQLENTLLKPGESANITVILTWENGEDNLALKTNVAEISEDFNEYGEEDIDSTPDNQVEGEDDIDDAPVLLSISTGKAKMYIALTAIVMITLAGGIILIKKFVI